MLKRLFCWLFFGLSLWFGHHWLVTDATPPLDADYPLDLAEIRRLADAVPGPKALQIRIEDIGTVRFTQSMIIPGDPWQAAQMEVYAYQLIFPGGTIIIDAGMPPDGMPGFIAPRFEAEAFRRLSNALVRADQIVITHEHFDHVGALTTHHDLEGLLPALRLTEAQLNNADRMAPARWPPGVFARYQPLRYERLHALAPGVVLIDAAGHTPGSQMVYVQLADGRELLFVGDVAWHQRMIDLQRERPRFMTLIIREDRDAVWGQLQALHALRHRAPELRLVPGHDGPVIEKLLAEAWLQPGFKIEQ